MADSPSMAISVIPDEPANYNINNLTDSLLIEILVRVPTCESAHQCKRWLSLISDAYFRSRFIDRHKGVSGLGHAKEAVTFLHQFRYFAYHDVKPDPSVTITSHPVHTKLDAITDQKVLLSRTSFELDFLPFGDTADIVASTKDLVVAYDRWVSFELLQKSLGTTFCICNLVTKKWTELPPAPSSYWNSGLVGLVTYEADPSETGVRDFKLHYKLVHMSNSDEFSAAVFSSETGEWSKLEVLSTTRFGVYEKYSTNSVTFRKKLHWIINKKSILTFDPFGCNNQRGFIDLPPLHEEGQSNETECLGICEENLQVSQLVRVNGEHRVIIWDLKDYNANEWCLKYNVRFSEMEFVSANRIDTQSRYGDIACLLAFHPHEKAVLYLRYNNRILICNVQAQTLEVINQCSRSWNWHLNTEFDTIFTLVHPCWPSPLQPL
ncbi:putative F-box/kelch-repeat protein At1g15680 [Silene latifolia]|uniref:putative F-box/kelch-repeat protein At1g15680 n=1 Tax=Silene latifolia TaxID=37657 RepID=UPI003D77CA1F